MAEKPDKSNKLKARLPRGLADRGPAEIAATRRMLETIRGVYERYGFEPVETPAIEYTDALGKFLPDQDRPNEAVFSFQDDDEQWLSLRYDLTAPLARYVAENFDQLPKPYRSYREGYVFRNEKPGPGRFRQFMQFDADTVGSASPAADAEICMMAADTMEALGIPRGNYVVKVNNRKLLDGILEAIGLGGEANAGKRLTVLRAIDKYDRLGEAGVRALLGEGRRDESGDVTEGARLNSNQADLILSIMRMHPTYFHEDDPRHRPEREDDFAFIANNQGRVERHAAENFATIENLRRRFSNSARYREGVDELAQIAGLAEQAGYGSGRILIDPSVVRGLEYYTGPVYEVELTFPIQSEDGKRVRFGSVAGGGRYDGLVARFRGEPVPATGFSIGVSRLAAALQHLKRLDSKPEPGPVVVTVFDRGRIADYQTMVASLRNAGIRAELYLGSGKMGPQLKYADKRGSPCVVIQGGDEKVKGEVQIKDLIEGAKAAASIASHQEWRETRPAQFSVPQEKLVEAVRDVLAGRGDRWANIGKFEATGPATSVRITDEEARDCFEKLWRGAFERRPFDAMCTLLRVAGLQDAGWDPFEESEQAFKDYNWYLRAQSDELSDKSQWRIGLLMYCQACEMSSVHVTLANLLRIHLGQPYHLNPLGSLGRAHKKRMFKWYPPSAKVKWQKIRDMAGEANKTDLVRLIDNVYDDAVRNAFSHSDYVLSEESFRWTESGLPGQVPLQEVSDLIANAFSFFGVFIAMRERWLKLAAGMPRYHRAPNFEVLELLKTDGKLDGFRVHFSNGNSAHFQRSSSGVDLMNVVIQPDGTINFMVGYLGALQNRYVVDGREVEFGGRNSVDEF